MSGRWSAGGVTLTVLAGLLLAAVAPRADANGRPPATSTINFRQGNDQHIAAGTTFGLVLSKDSGQTWHWMCEAAVKYGGMYDPDYAYTTTGALFATTFDGSLVNRDGCSFDPTPFAKKFISAIEQGPTGHVFVGLVHPPDTATSDPGDSKIYKSIDDGLTFPVSAGPAAVGIWWSSIEVAPSNAQRVYLSGYRLVSGNRMFELFKSDDGGASYTALQTTGITTTRNSTIEIVGISAVDSDLIYARVTYQVETRISDAIYRSADAGTSWTLIRTEQDEIAFLLRANGDLVIGTRNVGAYVSTSPSNGAAWTALTNPPHINCLAENAAGEVWACTQNFGNPQVPSDNMGIAKTTDLVTWTSVLRYQDILGPVACAVGTVQRDTCVDQQPSPWCSVKNQFGITANPTGCPAVFDSPPDGPGGDFTVKPPKSCCSAGGPEGLGIGLIVGALLLRPRRRRTRAT